MIKSYVRFRIFAHRSKEAVLSKLRENAGISDVVVQLILVLIAVVIGSVLLVLFGDTIKEVWVTIKTRIMDLFNYS